MYIHFEFCKETPTRFNAVFQGVGHMLILRTIVDENDCVVGAASPSEIKLKGYIARIAGVLIVRSNGNIVLHKVSPKKDGNQLKWNVTAAGHVDAGETYEQAAIRELEEEVGVKATAIVPIGSYCKRNSENGRPIRFSQAFKMIYDGAFKPDENEIAEIREFAPHELRKLMESQKESFTWFTCGALSDYLKT